MVLSRSPKVKPVGRLPDPVAWMDRELAFQLLETIGADSDKRAVTRAIHAWQTIERDAYGDIALGEHLAAGLEPRERHVVIFRTLHGECRARTAAALGLDPGAIIAIEHSACLKAATLTCRYHDNLICEPAELASSVGHTQREEAVSDHLSRCSRCGPEFAARVANVLHHSASFMTEDETPAPR
jgi:Fe2+ transport system protein FeoA